MRPSDAVRNVLPSVLYAVTGEEVREPSEGRFVSSRIIDAGWTQYRRNVIVRVKPDAGASRVTVHVETLPLPQRPVGAMTTVLVAIWTLLFFAFGLFRNGATAQTETAKLVAEQDRERQLLIHQIIGAIQTATAMQPPSGYRVAPFGQDFEAADSPPARAHGSTSAS